MNSVSVEQKRSIVNRTRMCLFVKYWQDWCYGNEMKRITQPPEFVFHQHSVHSGVEGIEVVDIQQKKHPLWSTLGAISKNTKLKEVDGEERQSETLFGNYNHQRFAERINLNKNWVHIITGKLTGRCRLEKHLYTIKIVKGTECQFSEIWEETYEIEEEELSNLKLLEIITA